MNRTRPLSATFVLSVAAAVALMAALPFAVRHSGFLINYSDSVRPVLFLRTTDAHALYIAFCAPESSDPAVLRAAFAQLPRGDCPGGRPPLLKPFIEATMAHPVTLGPNGFTFDGKLLPNTAPKPLSRFGSRLTHYPFGRYQFGIWPISTENPTSYDARYFGPIPPSAIRYRAIAILEVPKAMRERRCNVVYGRVTAASRDFAGRSGSFVPVPNHQPATEQENICHCFRPKTKRRSKN